MPASRLRGQCLHFRSCISEIARLSTSSIEKLLCFDVSTCFVSHNVQGHGCDNPRILAASTTRYATRRKKIWSCSLCPAVSASVLLLVNTTNLHMIPHAFRATLFRYFLRRAYSEISTGQYACYNRAAALGACTDLQNIVRGYCMQTVASCIACCDIYGIAPVYLAAQIRKRRPRRPDTRDFARTKWNVCTRLLRASSRWNVFSRSGRCTRVCTLSIGEGDEGVIPDCSTADEITLNN